MIYSMVPAAMLIINLILNGESLIHYGFRVRKQGESDLVHVRYNHFILAACCYFFVDGTWRTIRPNDLFDGFGSSADNKSDIERGMSGNIWNFGNIAR